MLCVEMMCVEMMCVEMMRAQAPQKKTTTAKKAAAPKPATAPVAPITEQPAKHPLESLEFTGNRRIASEKIAAASGLKIGQAVEKEEFEAARASLLATGAFESAGFVYQPSKSGTGFDATFEVVEVAQMFLYQFEDLPLSDEVLRAVIAKQEPIFGAEIPAARPVLERIERALTEAVGGGVKVEAHMLATLKGDPKIVFRLPGERPRISQVIFAGNKEIPTAKLAMTFYQVILGTEFKESVVRALLDQSIRPLYEARGFIRVAFPKVVAEKSIEPEVDAVAVTVTIDEGEEFKLGQIRYAGGVARDLEKTAGLRTRDLADFDEVKKAQDRIVQKQRAMGYLHAAVKQERTLHDDQHTVDLLLTLEPGAQFHYGKLTIQGLDLIAEPAIRKMWGDRTGKPFDPGAPDAFLKEIRDGALFDNLGNTSASTKVNEDAKAVDVTLVFEGTKGNAGKERPRRGAF
jgi:outer membrane protein insertion porin family